MVNAINLTFDPKTPFDLFIFYELQLWSYVHFISLFFFQLKAIYDCQ